MAEGRYYTDGSACRLMRGLGRSESTGDAVNVRPCRSGRTGTGRRRGQRDWRDRAPADQERSAGQGFPRWCCGRRPRSSLLALRKGRALLEDSRQGRGRTVRTRSTWSRNSAVGGGWKGFWAPGAGRPVDGVLQRAGDGPVVLRGHEQHSIRTGNRLLELRRLGRIVVVEVLAVERQVADRDLGELEVLRRQADECPREHAVDRRGGETSDEVADLVHRHLNPFRWAGWWFERNPTQRCGGGR